MLECQALFQSADLGDRVLEVSGGGDPAKAYDRYMRRVLLLQRMEEVLAPRELNLVRCYLGLGQPEEQGMTFQELAIRLNYNGPSGAEKAYKSAIRKLTQNLHGGAVRSVAGCPAGHPGGAEAGKEKFLLLHTTKNLDTGQMSNS